MEIKVPYEIGDPILVIDYNQYDGYYINCRPFCWNDIPNVDKDYFQNSKRGRESYKGVGSIRKEEIIKNEK